MSYILILDMNAVGEK